MIDNVRLHNLINDFRKDNINLSNIRSIIYEYDQYQLYIIKYIMVQYPIYSAIAITELIVDTKLTKIMECILNAYSVKACDQKIMEDFVCMDKCDCYDRKCWNYIYFNCVKLLDKNPDILTSPNFYNSFVTLLLKTDVIDKTLFDYISNLVRNPQNWKIVLKFIMDAELFGDNYGDIIFQIRDMILENNKLNEIDKNRSITDFQNKSSLNMLISLLHKYNDIQKNITKISDNMFITDFEGATNVSVLRDKKIDFIISLTKKPVFKISHIEYIRLPIDDNDSVDFVQSTIKTVDKVIDYIKNKKIVLVHCYKGVSRSVSFAILVLIKQGMLFDDAFEFVKNKRDSFDPNPEFIRQIIEFTKINK